MRLGASFSQARRFVLAGVVAGIVLFGFAQIAQATVSNVTFAGASQVTGAVTTWTINFRVSTSGLAAGETVSAEFPGAFIVPATPTIALTNGFSNCSATGSTTTGTTVTFTLANSGGTCALATGTTGRFTVAGITNPAAGTYASATFRVKTSDPNNTAFVNDGSNETISGTPTITSVSPASGPTTGGTTVTITGIKLAGTTGVTFDGIAGTSLTNVSATSITVVTPSGSVGEQDVRLTTGGGSVTDSNAFTYVAPRPSPRFCRQPGLHLVRLLVGRR